MDIFAAFLARYLLRSGTFAVVFLGIQNKLSELLAQIELHYKGIGAELYAVASIAGIDECITIIISALAGIVAYKFAEKVIS